MPPILTVLFYVVIVPIVNYLILMKMEINFIDKHPGNGIIVKKDLNYGLFLLKLKDRYGNILWISTDLDTWARTNVNDPFQIDKSRDEYILST